MADTRSVLFRLEEADKMLRKGEFSGARGIYVALLADAPAEMQGAIQLRIDRVDELSAPGERGQSARAPQDTTAQARAETAANEGRLDDAIEIYAEIIATRPDDQLARERLTELLAAKTRVGKNKPAPIRTISSQDMQNANAAGDQESGPLGRALHDKGKHPPAAAPQAPVPSTPPAFDPNAFGRPGSVVGFLNPQASRSQPPMPAAPPPAPPPVMRPTQPPPVAATPAQPPRPTAPTQPPAPARPVAPAPAPAQKPSAPLPSDPVEMLKEALNRIRANRRRPSPFAPFTT